MSLSLSLPSLSLSLPSLSLSLSLSPPSLSLSLSLSPHQLVDTTVEIANKVGGAEIVSRVVEDLKDENEQYRKMVMDCIEKVRSDQRQEGEQ